MFTVVDESPIVLPSGLTLEVPTVMKAVEAANEKFRAIADTTSTIAFNVFEVLDFRMLSGTVGESFVSTMAATVAELQKNPNIDGYPDLMDVSQPSFREDVDRWLESDMRQFIAYPHGGLEVKNTFGTKKTGSELLPGEERITRINRKLDWKAHHRTTNYLLATLSDFIGDCPQIVAAMFSDALTEDDWAVKQNPKAGSTMTSFSVIKSSGYEKLRRGLKLCLDEPRYEAFLKPA